MLLFDKTTQESLTEPFDGYDWHYQTTVVGWFWLRVGDGHFGQWSTRFSPVTKDGIWPAMLC